MNVEQFVKEYNPGMSEYCSAVVDVRGDVVPCQVNHLKTMIELYGDPDVLTKIPKDNSPLFWLINKLECVLVDYENQIFSGVLNEEQERTLKYLAAHELICENRKNIHGHV